MTTNRQLRVFLCHSSKDKDAVRELYKKLHVEKWIDRWLDEEKLLPGQDWHIEIEKAVEATDVVVVLLSNQSVSQEGYVQRELKLALDVAEEKPEGAIFIVPLRLDECPAPRRLKGWHYVDYFPADRKDWAVERLIASLKTRAEALDLKFEEPAPQKASKPVEKKKPVIETPKPAKVNRVDNPAYENKLTISNGMEFMRVPAGKFLMGSNNGADSEKPQHTVDIPYDYWMGRFPVTNEQYSLYVKAKGISDPVSNWENKKNHPAVNISWDTIMEYCGWLNNLLKAELPSDLVLRLPTEAEWEKAARGTDGREYPWGNEFEKSKCNSKEGGIDGTTFIGLYSPQSDSPYGCADMAGNVWEWTHSENKVYPYNAKDGREDEHIGVIRALHGGSFRNLANSAHCSSRNWGNPDLGFRHLGFRMTVSQILTI
jgi:formylglycine-generating enzyme required for sulfatase activity